ncbi:hypothetical protein DUNSADRAFT_3109 [Dunaliella salina]|uniref:K Homology domain-containing protein n=1 Tax=Dunaliella salina TaxID=3046 RepID=A0ABQ7FVP8_DUNSA|nr:hypothetical protein DUNSADRAFT_3109 [Dunaliella salina]|eukprot:KAF5826432.1 hypothetical protein DUNSADRAFT_3109 [Dunaliella salina]
MSEQAITKTISVKQEHVGLLIGKEGKHLRLIRDISGAEISLQNARTSSPSSLCITATTPQQMSLAVQLATSACNSGFILLYSSANCPVHAKDVRDVELNWGVSIRLIDPAPPDTCLQALILPRSKGDAGNVHGAALELLKSQRERKAAMHIESSKLAKLKHRAGLANQKQGRKEVGSKANRKG